MGQSYTDGRTHARLSTNKRNRFVYWGILIHFCYMVYEVVLSSNSPVPQKYFRKNYRVWGFRAVCGGGSREGRAQEAATPQLREVLPWTSEKIPDRSQAEGELTLVLPLSSGMCTDTGGGGLSTCLKTKGSQEKTLRKVRSYCAFLATAA